LFVIVNSVEHDVSMPASLSSYSKPLHAKVNSIWLFHHYYAHPLRLAIIFWHCGFFFFFFPSPILGGGETGRALDLQSIGREFKFYSRQCHVTWANCLHLCASVTKQHNLVPAKWWWSSTARELTAGLAESNGMNYKRSGRL